MILWVEAMGRGQWGVGWREREFDLFLFLY